ncbi:MAG: hypothetical protein PHR36_02530 [Patescibacteria group bacterium]|nr:hypothetical protein [Patescibacteria group bacterium]
MEISSSEINKNKIVLDNKYRIIRLLAFNHILFIPLVWLIAIILFSPLVYSSEMEVSFWHYRILYAPLFSILSSIISSISFFVLIKKISSNFPTRTDVLKSLNIAFSWSFLIINLLAFAMFAFLIYSDKNPSGEDALGYGIANTISFIVLLLLSVIPIILIGFLNFLGGRPRADTIKMPRMFKVVVYILVLIVILFILFMYVSWFMPDQLNQIIKIFRLQ